MAMQFLLVLTLFGISLLPQPAMAQKPANAPKSALAQKPASSQKADTTPKSTPKPATKPSQILTQSNPYPITPADSAVHFADSIFHYPTLLYQLVQPDIPADIQSILVRFNNALVANRDWFQQYRAAYAGKPLPYNERFGITPDQYKKLQNLEQAPLQLTPIDTQKVTVTREAGYLRFTTDGDVRLLDYLQIDLRKNFVVFGGDTIPFAGHTIATAASPYGQWDGYTWRLQKADAASSLATSRVTARVVEVNMGLTAPTEQSPQSSADSSKPAQTQPQTTQPQTTQPQTTQPQTTQPINPRRVFLRLKYQDMKDGETKANLELVGYLLQ